MAVLCEYGVVCVMVNVVSLQLLWKKWWTHMEKKLLELF